MRRVNCPDCATTTWQYSGTRGFLLAKRDAANKGADYTHTAAGRLASRTWGRSSVAHPKSTEYSYDAGGRMVLTNYSDTTPDITVTYDALGRQLTQSNGLATSTFAYNPGNLAIDTETVAYNLDGQPGAEFTRVLDRSQDTLGRDTGWQLKDGTTVENEAAYTYGTTHGRLSSISNPQSSNVSFAYGYVPGSSLVETVTGPAHTVTNTYEANRDILASKENKVGTTNISTYSYGVNQIGQRTGVSQAGTAFQAVRSIAWGYDALGQVISADSTVTGLNRAYIYDMIGNRLKSAEGTTDPDDLSATTYTPNALNQYSAISSLAPSYDDDGNMTSGPLPANVSANSTLIWDAENRLIQAQITGGNTVTYGYDAQSRRISATVGSVTTVYVYDGWNPIAEYGASYALTKTYTWGMDLSGTMQGAGGVGGLLSVSDGTGTYYPTYDGNGNVSEYLDGTGTVVAHYEYDPFGKTTVASEAKAQDFVHRFSTKPLDVTTGLYYYGYRYYDPVTGRWPSRDPIEEIGGLNMYAFVNNVSTFRYDYLGLEDICSSCEEGKKNALLDSRYEKMKAQLIERKCSEPTLTCRCKTDEDNTSAGGNYWGPTNTATLFCNSTYGSDYFKQLALHEYQHAVDYCYGLRPENSCEDRACTETRAYARGQCASETDPVKRANCAREGAIGSMQGKGCENVEGLVDSAMNNPQCYEKIVN